MISDTTTKHAAEVMVNQVARHRHGDHISDTAYWTQDMERALSIAAALAAAGLLCTPQERAVIDAAKRLSAAIIDLCWRVTPYGETDDGDIANYIVSKGTVHRLIGAAQTAGIPAAFRTGTGS